MKKTFLFFVPALLIISSKLYSQTIVNETRPPKALCAIALHPLILVDGFETDAESMSLDPNHIKTIDVLKNGSAIEKYGEKAKDGAILITTKPGTQFFKINDFVDPSKDLNTSITRVR